MKTTMQGRRSHYLARSPQSAYPIGTQQTVSLIHESKDSPPKICLPGNIYCRSQAMFWSGTVTGYGFPLPTGGLHACKGVCDVPAQRHAGAKREQHRNCVRFALFGARVIAARSVSSRPPWVPRQRVPPVKRIFPKSNGDSPKTGQKFMSDWLF